MIDFCKKIGIKPKENKISPVDIYNVLDHKTDADPLRPVQERVLTDWNDNRRKGRSLRNYFRGCVSF